MSDKKYILGIDPGNTGALAIISVEVKPAKLVNIIDMPIKAKNPNDTDSKAKDIDVDRLITALDFYKNSIHLCVIEKVGAMSYVDAQGFKRGQGAAASFSFGKGYGILVGVLKSLNIRVIEVNPAVWKISMGLNASKSGSIQKAKEFFPSVDKFLTAKKHDGRAEALLLAHFGMRFLREEVRI